MNYDIFDGYLSGEEGVEEVDTEVLDALAGTLTPAPTRHPHPTRPLAPTRPSAPTPVAGGILRFRGRGRRRTKRGRKGGHKGTTLRYRGSTRGRGSGGAHGGSVHGNSQMICHVQETIRHLENNLYNIY